MKKREGWAKVKGYEVYIKDGRIIRGILYDGPGPRAAYPYKATRHGWEKGAPKVSTFYGAAWSLR